MTEVGSEFAALVAPPTNGRPVPSTEENAAADDAYEAAAKHHHRVAEELETLRVREDARGALAAERAAEGAARLPRFITLADALAGDDEPERWRIEGLLPEGGNATLIAPEKAGKTTAVLNLVRSLVDGEPFLGRHDVAVLTGRVAILNYEITARMSTRWLREIEVHAAGRVVAMHLRGHRLALLTEPGVAGLAEQLRTAEVEVLVVDPFGAAFRSAGGVSENDNAEVGRFLSALDEVKQRANVGELVMPVHARRDMAEGAERARAASVLGDWPDTLWTLTRDGEGRRFLSARGRDVDVPEQRLAFDPATRRLTIAGASRAAERARDSGRLVTAALSRGGAASFNQLEHELVRDGGPLTRRELRAVLDALVRDGSIDAGPGPRRAVMYSVDGPIGGRR